jgi:Zn-dependent protease with chaperone function
MLTALQYHLQVKNYFKAQSKTWQYFLVAQNKEEQLTQYKTELLKNTYKFDEVADTFIYEKVQIAKNKLGLQQLPVTVYQAQYTDELNASIVFLNNEAHIVFSGPVTKLLDSDELLAVIAHELSHIKLYTLLDGELEVADRIITAIANNHSSEAAYYETARLFKLYTEIFCDRGAYQVLQQTEPVITSLVKASTGLEKVHANSYLKQADEIFAAEKSFASTAISHPENFIRAKAIDLWHQKKELADAEIIAMIEGVINIDQLDLFKQQKIAALTNTVLQLFLKPNWFKTTIVIGLAKQYFTDFNFTTTALLQQELIVTIQESHQSIQQYLACVLYDFVQVDATLEETPAGWAIQFAEDIQLKNAYDTVLKKELQLSDKKLQQYKQKMLAIYYEVKEGDSEQIYV